MRQKKKRSFPTSYTVLFIVLIFAIVLTYVIPAGKFSRLTFNRSAQEFVIVDHNGDTTTKPGTEETLKELNINLGMEKFESGAVRKPIAIPGSYQQIEQHPQSFFELVNAPIQGLYSAIDIMTFVLILGGVIGVLNKMKAFDAGVAALSKATKGKEFLLVVLIFTIVTIGGTTFGMAEETIAFYPILLPIFLLSGFDILTGIAAIHLGSTIGTMYSTVNAFSVVVASDAAGISFSEGLTVRMIILSIAYLMTIAYIYWYSQRVKKDPTKSIVYGMEDEIKSKLLKNYNADEVVEFNWRIIVSLLVFVAAFPIMIWGVAGPAQWWFGEMSALFLGVGFIIMAISGLGEKVAVSSFISGAADLVGVALIIGLARSINGVMNNGYISDTLLYYCTFGISLLKISR